MTATLLAVFGDDLMVVNAARVSFSKVSDLGADGTLAERDVRLIRYLARHRHWTPFAHPQAQFRIKAPLFVARQWFKHQIGFARNEVSRRYVDDPPEFWVPGPDGWRGRAENVKQGSGDVLPPAACGFAGQAVWRLHAQARGTYEQLLQAGVCPEQARVVLPQSTYTEWIETASLYAYARLLRLRLDPHAQAETRELAGQVEAALRPHFPVSLAALLEDE